MGQIRALFFWLSGIYTQAFPDLLAQALSQAGGRPVNPLALPEFAAQLEGLITGKIDDLQFCRSLGEAAGIEAGPEALRGRILEAMAPNPGAIQATRQLPEAVQRWLLVDFPDAWFEPSAARLGVNTCFAPENMIRLSSSGLPRLVPDVFYHMAFVAGLPMQDCLLIDASSKRGVQALNQGLPTEIYVDNRRLTRMFIMRGFIDRPQPVHRPATAGPATARPETGGPETGL